MIYRHKKTGRLYFWLMRSFDVEKQEHHDVYMQLETGHVFNRSSSEFDKKFELINDQPQDDIVSYGRKDK